MSVALSVLTSWDPAPVPCVALLVSGVLYLAGTRRVGDRAPTQPWATWRTVCFVAGLLMTAVALVGPPGAFDDVFFYAHMTQHILLTTVAAPLLVLGDPVLLLMRVSSREVRRRWLVPCLRSHLVHALSHPVVGWALFVGVMGLSHWPPVYDGFLTHPILHDYVEHLAYLLSGLLFFYPLLGPTAGRRHVAHWVRMASLFTVMVPMAILGFFIFADPRLAYAFYAHVDRPFGPGPLADQRLAGILMWSTSMVVGVVWLVVAARNWWDDEERRTVRFERAVPEAAVRT